jgi:NTP pyrophosphatase (non-canonical NTP hydrolase)
MSEKLFQQLREVGVKSWEHDQTAAALNALAADIHTWASDKGFWNTPGGYLDGSDAGILLHMMKSQKVMLVVTELAELVEGLRKPSLGAVAGSYDPESGMIYTNEEEEVADAIIRLLDYAGAYGLRIGEALCAKMTKNEGRPFRHGKEF